ncbi:MAG: hypothetical protein QOE86_1728 [Solirubrobacteraceae bacterium]|jgi:hypothetical protein|nr:hypothetical protein [Solirubrobacteraceae bacterium]
MSEHEELHQQAEREADELERESERLGERVDEARKANEALESDELIATPRSLEDSDEDDGPSPEAQYPAKD